MDRKIETNLRADFLRAAERGLTLVEIIIVLVILSILIGFLTKGLFGKGQAAQAKINLMKMERLKSAINTYQLQYNSLPNSLDALVNCSEQTGQGCVPVATEDDLNDVFGTKFTYSSEGGRSYRLKSMGADRAAGGSGADADQEMTGP